MKKITASAIRTTSGLALGLCLVLALLIPVGYFIMSYERQSAVLETEAEATAAALSRVVSANPRYWRYEQPRLEGFLARRASSPHQEIRLIADINTGAIIAEQADTVQGPFVTRSYPLYDSGDVVARVSISRSLRPFLARTAGMGVLGFVLGAGAFFLFRIFPLRALKQALRSLQESEARFRAIASTAADAIVVMNHWGVITYWNQAAEKMFGYSAEKALGRELQALIAPPKFQDSFWKGFQQFLRTSQDPAVGDTTLELTALHESGTEFPIEVSTSAIVLNNEWHALGIIRDVSERKQTEMELMKLEKLESLGVLAGGIAHDFNNLLTVMLGRVSLVQLDTDRKDERYRYLEDVEKAVLRARSLTQQLLTFSKGGAPVKRTSSIREIVEESCTFSLSGSSVRCDFSFADDLNPVDVDAGQIGQVLHNIVLNSVQAMHGGGIIRIECGNVSVEAGNIFALEPGPYIKISVRDQGGGISPDIISKIFDPYFTTKQKGSGLGLATSYSIIKKHGGYLSAESEPGRGSVFHVYLPASKVPQKEHLISAARGMVTGCGRVLVMDDEEAVGQVVSDMLRTLGYEPTFVRDGVEALSCYQDAAVSGSSFTVVILDLTIPGGMGGKETVTKLLELDPRAKVVVASGYSNDPVMADFRSFGFSAFIAKPYSLETLAVTLQSLVG